MNPAIVEPTVDYVSRAKDVAKIADRHADEGDRAGRIPQPVVDALHREGLFGIWVPRTVPRGRRGDRRRHTAAVRRATQTANPSSSDAWFHYAGWLAGL